MKLGVPEGDRKNCADCGRHMALARIGGTHPIAEAARLCATAANIGEREPADENIVVLAKNEECIGEVAALVLAVALDAAAKGGAGGVVGRASRVPKREKGSAF